MSKFWNDDIKNSLIGGLYAQLIWVAPTSIYLLVKKLYSNVSFSEAWRDINLFLNQDLEVNLSLTPAIIIIFLITMLMALAFRLLINRDPFKWKFDGFLGMNGKGVDSDNPVYSITSFQAVAYNSLNRAVTDVSGFVEVDSTKEKFPMYINRNGNPVPSETLFSIPSKEKLSICAFFGKDIESFSSFKGIEPSVFKGRYIPFTFVVIVEDKEFRYSFKEKRITKLIDSFTMSTKSRRNGPLFKD